MRKRLRNFDNEALVTAAALIVFIHCCSVVAGAQNADGLSWARCFARLEIPAYPPIARQAGVQGLANVAITIRNSRLSGIAVTGHASNLLTEAVRRALQRSKVASECETATLSVDFDFRIEGKATSVHSDGVVVFMPPRRFVISVPPSEPQPEHE